MMAINPGCITNDTDVNSDKAYGSLNDLPTSFQSSRTPSRRSKSSDSQLHISDMYIIDKYYDKKFHFHQPEEGWRLPPPGQMFNESKWKVKTLQNFKLKLNSVKSQLNNFNLDDWHKHTRATNRARDIQWKLKTDMDPEFLTQAWCKFYENVVSFPLVTPHPQHIDRFCSMHLCEAPGAFIASLNHYLKTKRKDITLWHWMATTLNPYHEGNSLSNMINDDRFIMNTLENWNFGLDYTGNLMATNNMLFIVEQARLKGHVMLVTADGSIDCQNNPGEQETVVTRLLYCEAITSLLTLSTGQWSLNPNGALSVKIALCI